MIIKTFSKRVIVIPRDIDLPYMAKHIESKRGLKTYNVSANDIALSETSRKKVDGTYETVIKIICGHSIYPHQIDMMIDYLIAASVEDKPILEIQECINLKFLNKIDKFVQTYNKNL